jgi:hypothetical protein
MATAVGRWGGEEFLAVPCPNTDAPGALDHRGSGYGHNQTRGSDPRSALTGDRRCGRLDVWRTDDLICRANAAP